MLSAEFWTANGVPGFIARSVSPLFRALAKL
jgi:hypothetical protein